MNITNMRSAKLIRILNVANLPQLRCCVCSAAHRPFITECSCDALICDYCRWVFNTRCFACKKAYPRGSPSKPVWDAAQIRAFMDNFFEDFDPLA